MCLMCLVRIYSVQGYDAWKTYKEGSIYDTFCILKEKYQLHAMHFTNLYTSHKAFTQNAGIIICRGYIILEFDEHVAHWENITFNVNLLYFSERETILCMCVISINYNRLITID